MKAFLLIFILFIISHQGPTNCHSHASGFGVLEMENDDCQDSTLCKVQCSDVGGNAELKLMKLNILDPNLPDQVKDSYYKTCTWELERKEILADTKMVNPQGRGQIISQYMATLGRTWRNKLPSPIEKVKETVLSVEGNVLSAPKVKILIKRGASGLNHARLVQKSDPTKIRLPIGNNKSAGGLSHARLVQKGDPSNSKTRTINPPIAEAMQGGISHARLVSDSPIKLPELFHEVGGINHRRLVQKGEPSNPTTSEPQTPVRPGSLQFASGVIAQAASSHIPTPKNLRDWVDFLIYVSNQYTFFQDLCTKHKDINKAFAEFEKKILSDAEVSLYSRYRKYDQKKIREFVLITLNKIITQFTLLYQDPTKTCGCLDIVNVISDPKQKAAFTQIINQNCRGKIVKVVAPIKTPDVPLAPTRTPIERVPTTTQTTQTRGKKTRVCVHQNHKNICIKEDVSLINIEISDE